MNEGRKKRKNIVAKVFFKGYRQILGLRLDRRIFYITEKIERFYSILLYSGHAFYPRLVERHPHVDPGEVGVGALDPVGHCPCEDPLAVGSLDGEGSSAVPYLDNARVNECEYLGENEVVLTFARVLKSLGVPCADKTLSNGLQVVGLVEHVLTVVVLQDGNVHFMQDLRDSSSYRQYRFK